MAWLTARPFFLGSKCLDYHTNQSKISMQVLGLPILTLRQLEAERDHVCEEKWRPSYRCLLVKTHTNAP